MFNGLCARQRSGCLPCREAAALSGVLLFSHKRSSWESSEMPGLRECKAQAARGRRRVPSERGISAKSVLHEGCIGLAYWTRREHFAVTALSSSPVSGSTRSPWLSSPFCVFDRGLENSHLVVEKRGWKVAVASLEVVPAVPSVPPLFTLSSALWPEVDLLCISS